MKNKVQYRGKKPPKILMVDDREANLISLEKVLKKVDAELVRAKSGNEALMLMLENEFALALLDVQMPEMDGYELAEIMRTDEKTSAIPIIFISAIFTDRINMFKGYEKGAFSFIAKPFEPIELINKVMFFIDKYHTEKAFEDSRLKYIDLYNSSPDMLLSTNVETATIIECNNTLLENTGFKKENILGEKIFTLIATTSQEKAEAAFEKFKDTGVIDNIELVLVTKDGQKMDVLLNAQGITDTKGKIIRSNCSLRNISELNQTKTQLENALRELKLYNQELENFVYLTSHDLQEPMITVLSYLQLLQEEYSESLEETAAEYIDYSVTAAGRMKMLITSLLNYLRIGHDNTTQKVDLNLLINEIKQELRGSMNATGAEIIANDLPTIKANKNNLLHLFRNLISNGIKFRKPDIAPILKISAQKDDHRWIFCVEDNGIGIEKKQYLKVFQIFKQLHERNKYEGMGIGMSACKKIVDQMNGEIWIDSEVDVGTKIYFSIPFSS